MRSVARGHFRNMPQTVNFCSYSEVASFIENLEQLSTSRFITQRLSNRRHFTLQPDDITSLRGHKVLFQDCQDASPSVQFDGTPYINIGWMVKECHHGPDKQRRAKERRKQKPTPGDHNYSRKGKSRKKIQDSKKQSCPAMKRIRAIMKFPDFKIDSYNNKFLKRQISRKLKQAFANRDPIKKSMVYLLSYPSANDHKNHLTGEFAGFTQRVDPKLVTRIKELVAEGVRNVSEMKRHLLISVKNDICPDQDIPKTNRRFFPLDKDIKNHMDIAINSLRFSKDDQLNLETLVESWQESNSEDSFFLRTSYDTTSQGDSPSEDFLFVHQTAWQRHLLDLYGRDLHHGCHI
ncbi:calcium-responsive transcription factor-like [Crassostrea virginica]